MTMHNIPEFYPTRQGRPQSTRTVDQDANNYPMGNESIPSTTVIATYSYGKVTENYTAGRYPVIYVDAQARPVTVTLPTIADNNGRYFTIKKVDSSSNIVTVASDELIDGAESVELASPMQYVLVHNNGSTWYIIGGEYVGLEDTIEERLKSVESYLERLVQLMQHTNIHLSDITDIDLESEGTEDTDG